MLKVGLKVVRGPNWSWGNEDGGEGFVGVLREINTTNKIAIVQWDNGNRMQCRIGYLDKYDIRVIDNAQIGIKHKNVVCDECNTGEICGMRYKCINCYDYDLCYQCYHGDKHDLNHSFVRITLPKSAGTTLPPRMTYRKCELKGVFKNAEVVRGVDWEWGNQDGGQGKLGIVLDVRGWKDKSKRSTVYIQWLHGNTELYRLGHKGYCDVQFVESSSGGHYYPEHLPVLGQTDEQMEWNLILDAIDIQQVMQLESEARGSTAVEVNDENNWGTETHSTLVQLGSIESMYAAIIMKYNVAVNKGSDKMNLVQEFSHMIGNFRNDEVKEVWEIIKYMAQLPEIPQSEDVVKNRYTKKFVETMVQNASKYLENSYKAHMLNVVIKNTLEPSLNDTYLLVHSFVGLRLEKEYLGLQDGEICGRPLWPMVYYSIRSGELATAVQCLESSSLAFPEIVSILKAKLSSPDDPSIGNLEENIGYYYRTVVRNETDPFKRAVWSILGACNELSEVIKTADDYLWFNLNVIHTDICNQYIDLQYQILEEHGESHYNAFDKPLLYFKLLLLTGQFEAAIDFLFRTDCFKIDGVHMAIALNEMNLLATSQDSTLPLISVNQSDPRPARRLNLVLIVKNYVSKFEESSLNGALHYFFLLRNVSNTNGKNMFEILVSELAINTKEYEKIFGKLQSNGRKSVCLLDQFESINVTMETVAQTLVERDLYEDVIDFVNDEEEILKVLCLVLSKLAHLENQPGSLRSMLQEKTTALENRLLQKAGKITPNGYSFLKLKGLLTFFDLYRAKQYPDALRELSNLEILPFKFAEIHDKVKNMKNFNEDFCKVIPNVLLATMTILLSQSDRIKRTENVYDPSGPTKHHQVIWGQTNCVINFAENLPHIVNKNITERLMQMEILMHSNGFM